MHWVFFGTFDHAEATWGGFGLFQACALWGN
jgi:hypothetical protein